MIRKPPGCENVERLHRPSDDAGLRREALELARLGLTPRDIAQCLLVHVEQVRGWLTERPL